MKFWNLLLEIDLLNLLLLLYIHICLLLILPESKNIYVENMAIVKASSVHGKAANLRAATPASFNFWRFIPKPLLTIIIHKAKFLILEDQSSGIPDKRSLSSFSSITIYLMIRPVINIPNNGGSLISWNNLPNI